MDAGSKRTWNHQIVPLSVSKDGRVQDGGEKCEGMGKIVDLFLGV